MSSLLRELVPCISEVDSYEATEVGSASSFLQQIVFGFGEGESTAGAGAAESFSDEPSSSKRPRGTDAEMWGHRLLPSTISSDLQIKCCSLSCVRSHLTFASVEASRLANAKRSLRGRRVFHRLRIRSMIYPGSEEVVILKLNCMPHHHPLYIIY